MLKTGCLTVIDLFCGCGGFSLGMENAGFKTLAAIDFNKEAIVTYKNNFPDTKFVLCRNLTQFPPEYLGLLLDIKEVDVIVGGPPCQGFSTARKRDGSNQGPRLIPDERRYLFKEFLKYVNYFKPKVFVMENVLGIKTTECGFYYKQVQAEARNIGYRVLGVEISACDYGVPQKRRRQLIIGTHKDIPAYFRERYIKKYKIENPVTLGEAIGELPELISGQGQEKSNYDLNKRDAHISKYGTRYLYDVLKANISKELTSHIARYHSERDLRDFSKLREGETGHQALNRGESLEFPYDRESFKDRYTRQDSNSLCSTIVAHLSKDGLMFIHPIQNRTLTPREAARIQSFPDTFEFPVPRTHKYRLIGNAVPPLVGEAVGKSIIDYLRESELLVVNGIVDNFNGALPKNNIEAAERLIELIKAIDDVNIVFMPVDKFKKLWFAFGYIYPVLHPDGMREKENGFGKSYGNTPCVDTEITLKYSQLASPFYLQSGCPVALEPVVKEAWRRYNKKELAEEEFFSNKSLLAKLIS